MTNAARTDPGRQARSRRARSGRRAPRRAVRLGDAGAGSRRLRARIRRAGRRAARLRRFQLHDGAASGAEGRRRRAGRRGDHGQPFVHRHGQRHPLLRRRPGLRRYRGGRLQHRSGLDRCRHHPATQGDPVRAPARHAVRPVARSCEVAGAHGLPVIEDAACAIGSEILWDGSWEKIGKPHGDIACFSFHPRKVVTTGDGGMLTTADPEYDRKFRLWRQHAMSVSDTVRHGARRGHLRDLSGNRLQLPHDRRPGGDRTRAIAPPAGDRRTAAAAGAALQRAPRRHSLGLPRRSSRAGRAATGRATASSWRRPPRSGRSCRRCWIEASPPGAAS